jgi:hypothetical protein
MYSTIPYRRLPSDIPHLSMMGLGAFDVVTSFNPVTAGISAGVGLATVALGSWLADKRATGQQKIASTSIVNDLEPLLRANVQAYLAGPGTCQDQAAALTAFDSAMQWLQSPQACGNLQLGAPGQACINDRMPGGQWDWYAYYRTPIANDPRPQCQTTADSAGQAAVANIINRISGSTLQTNAQSFSTDPTVQAQQNTVAFSSGLNLGGNVSIGGSSIPVEYLLLGGLAVALVVIASS